MQEIFQEANSSFSFLGLRVMAESVNHNVTAWFRETNWQPNTNVVAIDFIRNSGIVRAAIEYNKYLGSCLRRH